jgi:hemerythrin-like domain-containing protein
MAIHHQPDLPSAVMKREHGFIKRVLCVLEYLIQRSLRGEGFEVAALRQCVEFFRSYADACHHAKEEFLLFPVLVNRGIPRVGGPIGVLLEEHEQGRAFITRMNRALEDFEKGDGDAEERFREPAAGYLRLLRQHIDKEDNVLFELGDKVMTDEDQESLRAGFRKVCCTEPGGRRHEDLERLAEDLERQWLGD